MKRGLLKTTADTNTSIGLLILRVSMGALILTHGFPKFIKIIEGNMQFGDPIGIGSGASLILAAFAEFICAILVILGLYTRLAVIPLLINMSVAAFIVHSADPFNVKEKALLFLFAFLTLLFTGAGKYSVDKKL